MRIALRSAVALGLLALVVALVVVSSEDRLSLDHLGLPDPEPWARIETVEFLEGRVVRVSGTAKQAMPGDSVTAYGYWPGSVGPGQEATVGAGGTFSLRYDFADRDPARPVSANLLQLEHSGKRQYVRVDWSKREWIQVR